MNYFIFNDLSFPFSSRFEAQQGIKIFLDIFKVSQVVGISGVRLPISFADGLIQIEIAKGYRIHDWLHRPLDISVDTDYDLADLRQRFRSLVTYAPFISDDEPDAQEENEWSTFKIAIGLETFEAAALGAAYLLDTICVSFPSTDIWDNAIIHIQRQFLQDDVITEALCSVKHAARAEHIQSHIEWLYSKRLESINRGAALWDNRTTILPHLVLCGEVQSQLRNIGQSSYFQQILQRLEQLGRYAEDFKNEEVGARTFADYGLNVSGESKKTMSLYGGQRRFRLPDGSRQLFEKHIKTGDLRFHFWVDEDTRQIYVGYIGRHLPI